MKKIISYIKDLYNRENKDIIFKDFDKKHSFFEVFVFTIVMIIVFSVLYIFIKK